MGTRRNNASQGRIRAVILDLDGTVYLGQTPVPGAVDFLAWLEERGIKRMFVTNRANRPPRDICRHLNDCGIACREIDIITTIEATVRRLKSGSAYVIGEEGLLEGFRKSAVKLDDVSPDYVVVSYDRGFNYQKMEKACMLIQKGAKFIATNTDKGLKVEDHVAPGTGSIVASIVAGTGVQPLIIGKPEPTILEMALEQLGTRRKDTIVVGDNVETDIPAGHRAGMRTALLLTGISRRTSVGPDSSPPSWILNGYTDLRRLIENQNGKS